MSEWFGEEVNERKDDRDECESWVHTQQCDSALFLDVYIPHQLSNFLAME